MFLECERLRTYTVVAAREAAGGVCLLARCHHARHKKYVDSLCFAQLAVGMHAISIAAFIDPPVPAFCLLSEARLTSPFNLAWAAMHR